MESKEDLEEYLTELLDPADRKHKRFIEDFLKRWKPAREATSAVPAGVIVSI